MKCYSLCFLFEFIKTSHLGFQMSFKLYASFFKLFIDNEHIPLFENKRHV